MNRIHKSILLLYLLGFSILDGQEKTYNLNEIIISAGRTPVSFANLGRAVIIITGEQIKSSPVNNVQDLLKYVSGVDLRARGTEGVQADIAIRGGSFEQTLILIDGIKISDPQTGHHNLNLPISLSSIERIEILKGHGARVFGANAFAGAVNIITKKRGISSVEISASAGQNGLFDLDLSTSIPFESTSHTFSVQKKKSDGYAHNTNFDLSNFSFGQILTLGNSFVKTFLGYIDKDFGANSFYSDRFPNQAERTITRIVSVTSELKLSGITVSPKIYWRNNFDDYHLDYLRPDWNHNTHHTQSYGAEIQSSFSSPFGATSLGGEIGKDEINSSNLGIHNRTKAGFFGEQIIQFNESINFSAGFYLYNYSSIGWKLWPGLDISYKLNDDVKLFASYGQAFRIPTFTELYYVSPANMGNVNLVHEQTTNYEFGFSYNQPHLKIESSIFMKDGNNLIDWVRLDKNDPWKVENVADVEMIGTEFSIYIPMNKILTHLLINNINLSYTYLSSNRKTGSYESKYLLDHLRHQLQINMNHDLPFQLTQSWFIRFEQRENSTSNFIVDSQISKGFGDFKLYLRATNLFNQSYFDIAGVPLPGRWLSVGISYSMKEL